MLAGAIVALTTELLIIFSVEAAIRCFRNQDARSLTWIQTAVVVLVVVMSLFILHKFDRILYLLCIYAALLCYRLVTGVTDNGTGSYSGYTVSKPLTSCSTVGDEDIEEVHDSRSARANHVTYKYELPRQFKTPTQKQSCLVNNAPKSERSLLGRVATETANARPAVAGVTKAQSVQAWIRPLTSNSAPSSTSSSTPSSTTSSTPSSTPSSTSSSTPPGLVNLGNTCFVNVVLQCLTWVPSFIDLLRSEPGGNNVVSTLQRTLEQCRGDIIGQRVDPTPLLQALAGQASHLVKPPKGLTSQGQQDAAEFLLWLLDHLHTIFITRQEAENDDQKRHREELLKTLGANRLAFSEAKSLHLSSYQNCLTAMSEMDWELHLLKNSSSIYSQFLGQVTEVRECQGCKTMSVNFEYFTVLPVPVVAHDTIGSLEECLSLFAQEEKMDKTNMIRCSCAELKFVAGKRIALLSHYPRNLILALKRFSYDVARGAIIKDNAPISVPLTLDLQPYTLSNRLQVADSKPPPYQLQALCTHTGSQSTSNGHYVAYGCTTSSSFPVTQSHASNFAHSAPPVTVHLSRWYCFNDTSVRHVKDMGAELRTKRLLENAYLLFYTAS